jgi:tyrocidine synthetase-3
MSNLKYLPELLLESFSKHGNLTAVSFQGKTFTYQELHRKSNQVANYLLSVGIGVDSVVGLAFNRSFDMVATMLGILKSGAAFVPLDVNYPQLRIKHIIEDSKVSVIITNQVNSECLLGLFNKVIRLEELFHFSDNYLDIPILHEQLAYIIYTSGSTGKPKGVCVTHGNLENVLSTFKNIYMFSANEAFIPNSSINFDPSLWQLLVPLLSGGILVLLDEQELYRADILTSKIKEWNVKLFHAVPSVLWTLLQDQNFIAIDSLSAILGGGEGWSGEILTLIKDNLPKTTLINVYGPTEATIHVTSWSRKSFDLPLSIPIGKVIENNKIYILNKNLQPVPVGVTGEIYIAGSNVARGYLDQPICTADKFIANPFVTQNDAVQRKNIRLYKTGDLGKYLLDGNIQFLGRADSQVKIRGFRIEISEIENHLVHPLLSKNIVLARGEGSNKKLIAYVIPKEAGKYSSQTMVLHHDKEIKIFSGVEVEELTRLLKNQLVEFLPEYMVPSEFIMLSDIPLTINGKIDNKCLLSIEPVETADFAVASLPQTDMQKALYSIWSEVLGRDNLSIYDSFFKVGGHSLLAMQMLSKVRNNLNVNIPLNVIFKHPTIIQLAEFIQTEQINTSEELPEIAKVSLPDSIPLSFSQQRLWLIAKLFPAIALYNIPVSIQLDGVLNWLSLEDAIKKIIQRHDSLRTNFIEDEDGFSKQIISSSVDFDLADNVIYLKNDKEIQNVMHSESNYVFDLQNEKLFRVKLVKVSTNKHILLFNIHHIIADGWSVQILLKDLSRFYNEGCSKLKTLTSKTIPFNYAQHSIWQRSWLKDDILEKQLSYWSNYLENIPEFINLPYDYERPIELKYTGTKHSISLPDELSRNLIALSHNKNGSLFMVMLAGLQCLLQKYSQQLDIVIGAPAANRHYPGSEEIIGFFVNTLALRAKLNQTETFNEILAKAIDSTLSGYEHQDVPFERLVEHLQIERHLNINPVFQVMLLVSKENDNYIPELDGLQVKFIQNNYDIAKFDLTFSIVEKDDGLIDITILYSNELFGKESICRLGDHFSQLLSQVVVDPNIKLEEIDIVTTEEKKQILLDWNDTAKTFSPINTIHSLFESQVNRTPHNIAAIHSGQTVTYELLNSQANRLARTILTEGVGPDVLVAVVMDKSLDMLVGLLAVLKAGGAYVPIDPSYPVERLKLLLSDINTTILLTQKALLGKCQDVFDKKILCVDLEMLANTFVDSGNLNINVHPNSLAYIIYTSGSTGKPKGVAIEHHSCTNTLQDINFKHKVTENDRSLMLSNYNFDLSVYDIFGLLGVGGAVVIPNDAEIKDPANFYKIVHEHNVTIWNSVPAFMQLWINILNKSDQIPACLRLIMLSGDKIPLGLPDQIHDKSTNKLLKIFSLGGATEASIWSIDYPIESVNPNWESIPYGKPLANQNFYVLDEFYSLAPIGIVGHLYIGGIGLARNYFKQPSLTAERFVANPFASSSGDEKFNNIRLYKTGDLGKYLPDGDIEFLGRSDSQVKIRGFRIELGEIEKNLVDPLIKQNIVLARNDAHGKVLVAYVVPADIANYQVSNSLNSEIQILGGDESESFISYLQNKLSKKLPDYMLPSEFVLLSNFPLTINAKVDSKILLSLVSVINKSVCVAPYSTLQKSICSIWKEVLKLNDVGITDNFFKIGGHSLLAAQMIAKIREKIGFDLALKVIFNNPTIAKLSDYIENNQEEYSADALNIENVDIPKEIPLSFAQQRLWVINKLFPNIPLYNIPVTLKLEGDINYIALEVAIQMMIKRHAAFRTNFLEADNENVYQNIHLERNFILSDHIIENDQTHYDILGLESNYIFDLQNDMLVRIKLIKSSPKKHILLINFHHIISDGWSIQLFLKELADLYNHISCSGSIGELKLQTVDYGNYTVWQRAWLAGNVLAQQLSYWGNHLENIPELINLPYNFVRPQEMKYTGATRSICLEPDLAKQIVQLGQISQSSLFMVILAALQCLLHKYTQQSDIVIGTPVANRHHPNTTDVIGLFVNTLALRGVIDPNATFSDILLAAREITLSGYAHQDLPFEQLVEHLKIDRNLNINPIFQVMLLVNSISETATPNLHGLQVSFIDSEYDVAKFDLTFNVVEKEEGLEIGILYSTELFTADAIDYLANHFKELLRQVAINPDVKLQDINILTSNEQQKILVDWNDTKTQYQLKPIHSLFEEQAKRTPNNIAATFKDLALSYGELNSQANSLARVLIERGVRIDTPVAVIIERSFEMLIGILAILKAGGAYVPLDPDFPVDRLKIVLSEIESAVVVTHSTLLNKCEDVFAGQHIVCVDTELRNVISCTDKNINLDICKNNLAYVIYTSGSTGKPKGVAIDHAGLSNRILWMQQQYKLDSNDKVLHKTPTTFDVSGWELHWPLITGATMVIAEPGVHKDAELLGNLIIQKNVTVLHFVPTMLEAMLNIDIKEKLKSLRMLFASGEALSASLYRTVKNLLGLSIHNLYGPTEASIDVTYNNVDYPNISTIPIGKPISNIQIYILDNNLNPTPVGITGQVFIQGIGLARGYIKRPDLTAEKFIANPFLKNDQIINQDLRLYQTGDLARWLPSGDIEYLGRIDSQVKIRGFRIELGEIEQSIMDTSLVQSCAVQVLTNPVLNNKYLEAFIVPFDDVTVEEQSINNVIEQVIVYQGSNIDHLEMSIKEQLSRCLPDYMVPTHVTVINQLPRNINGKLDNKLLEQLSVINNNKSDTLEHIQATNEFEVKVSDVWNDVLKVNDYEWSITDDFFKSGGDSILAIRMVVKLNKVFNTQIQVKDIFLLKTIRAIAADISTGKFAPQSKDGFSNGFVVEINPSPNIEEKFPASYLQTGMLLASSIGDNHTYHDVFNYSISHKFNESKFIDIWNVLVKKHSMLRASFLPSNNAWDVCIHKVTKLKYSFHDDCVIEDIIDLERNNDFDYSDPGLFRLIVNTNKIGFDFILSFHHAVADGWSIASLINEFLMAYVNDLVVSGVETLSYSEYVKNESIAINDRNANEFWRDYSRDIELISLRSNFYLSNGKDGLHISRCELDKDSVYAVNKIQSENNVSADCIFLQAFVSALHKFTAADVVTIGLVTNNRIEKEYGDEFFGMFLNTVPLKTDIKNNLSLHSIFAEKVMLKNYQHVPYGHIRSLLNKDVFECAFNYINFHILQNSEKYITDVQAIERTSIPFMMHVAEKNKESYAIRLVAHDDYMSKEMLDRFLSYLHISLDEILHGADPKIINKDLSLIQEMNDTSIVFPVEKTIPTIFEDVVRLYPNRLALTDEFNSYSYHELNIRANCLANQIRQRISNRNEPVVALMLDRGADVIISILAVLKAGAAYLPLDATHHHEQTKQIIEIAQPDLIICHQSYEARLNQYNVLRISELSDYCQANLNITTNSNNLAYILFTSGTTGIPKGVGVSHKGVINLIDYLKNVYDIRDSKNIAAFSSYTFDVSVSEFFSALLQGGTLHILSEEDRHDPILLQETLIQRKINYVYIPPVMLSILPTGLYPDLKSIIYAGEPCPKDIASRWSNKIKLFNYYGPTEATIYATGRIIKQSEVHLIGRPVANTTCYVLDKTLSLVPVGAVGELYIGGVGVARGYLYSPNLTAEKFIANPFVNSEDQNLKDNLRLYKTGDLVKVTSHGDLEYLGRSDNQIKIRGFRVELEEIEMHLRNNKFVSAVKVLYIDEHIRAYVVPKTEAGLSSQQVIQKIINAFSIQIPQYMRPTQYVLLTEIPTNSSGKIDIPLLKTMQPESISIKDKKSEYTCPVEATIAAEFSSVLGGLAFDRDDNFFAIGGNSILAAKLAYKVNDIFNSLIKVSDIYVHKSVSCIASLIKFNSVDKNNLIKLNACQKEDDIYMIHPGGVGCEVYQKLALELTNSFNCFGIDSYNMYAAQKITDIEKLARLYLSYIDAQRSTTTSNDTYNILGWSLGGYIALEMARQLEERGIDNIRVILLDTVWMYGNDSPLLDHENINNFENEIIANLKQRFSDEGFDKYHINNRVELTRAELQLSRPLLRRKLKNTEILLFKAMLEDNRVKTTTVSIMSKYIARAKTNNIEYFTESLDKLKTINLTDVGHNTILDNLQPLLTNICEFVCAEKAYEA